MQNLYRNDIPSPNSVQGLCYGYDPIDAQDHGFLRGWAQGYFNGTTLDPIQWVDNARANEEYQRGYQHGLTHGRQHMEAP